MGYEVFLNQNFPCTESFFVWIRIRIKVRAGSGTIFFSSWIRNPDAYQNDTDPQHCLELLNYNFRRSLPGSGKGKEGSCARSRPSIRGSNSGWLGDAVASGLDACAVASGLDACAVASRLDTCAVASRLDTCAVASRLGAFAVESRLAFSRANESRLATACSIASKLILAVVLVSMLEKAWSAFFGLRTA